MISVAFASKTDTADNAIAALVNPFIIIPPYLKNYFVKLTV